MSIFYNKKNPCIVRNQIENWPILKWDKWDWCRLFGHSKLKWRVGETNCSMSTQWENKCRSMESTMEEFWEASEQITDTWMYFDYKEMKGCIEDTQVLKGISWKNFGFTKLDGRDSTIWIGNEGAHTPCHVDTYGYNLVAQIYGRKSWLLISPEETDKMRPTRVPYEESSIYSEINFHTPNTEMLKLEKVYRVVLEPGDVLFVPRHWWHYVENLGIAISVNVWIPTEEDSVARLEEVLVRRLVYSIAQDVPHQLATKLLNPNEYQLLQEPPDNQLMLQVAKEALRYRKTLEESRRVRPEILEKCSVPSRGYKNNSETCEEIRQSVNYVEPYQLTDANDLKRTKEDLNKGTNVMNNIQAGGDCQDKEACVMDMTRDAIERAIKKRKIEGTIYQKVLQVAVTEDASKDILVEKTANKDNTESHIKVKVLEITDEDILNLNPMSEQDKIDYLKEKGLKCNYDPFSIEFGDSRGEEDFELAKALVNSFCNPAALSIAREHYLKSIEKLVN